MDEGTILKVVAIVCIALLELVALWQGIDGTLLSMVVAVISGLAGYQYAMVTKSQKRGSRTTSRKR